MTESRIAGGIRLLSADVTTGFPSDSPTIRTEPSHNNSSRASGPILGPNASSAPASPPVPLATSRSMNTVIDGPPSRHLTHTQLLQSKSLTVGHGAGVSPHLLRPLTKSLRNQLARSPRDPAPDVPPRLIQRRLHQKERIPMRPPLPETTDTAVPPHQPLRAGQVVPAQPLPPHPLQPGRSHPRNQHRPPRAALPRLQTPRRRRQLSQRRSEPRQLGRLLAGQIEPGRHPLPEVTAPIPCRHLPPIRLGHQHRLPSHRMTPHLLPEQQLLFDLICGQVPDASFPHIHISNLQSSCDRKRPPAIAGGRPVSLYVAGDQRLSSKVSSKDRATRRRSPWPAPPPPP